MNQAIKFHKEMKSKGWLDAKKGNFMTLDLMLQWLKRIPKRHEARSTRGIAKISGRTLSFKDGSELRLL